MARIKSHKEISLAGRNRKVLIVDDNVTNISLLTEMLEPEGYKIGAATSGFKALNLVPKFQPDIILLDVRMPDMIGFEVCRKLKANPEFADIPIIFVTAAADEFIEGYEAGGVDYIGKPVIRANVLARVKNHLQLRELMAERLSSLEREAADRLSRIVNTVPDAIITFESRGKITSFNPAAEELFGYSDHQVIGKNIKILFPSRYEPIIDAFLGNDDSAGNQSREGGRKEIIAFALGGRRFPAEISIDRFRMNDNWQCVVVVRDISERRKSSKLLKSQINEKNAALRKLEQAKDELVQTEKLASLGGLVSGISHEINNPVGISVTAASYLQDSVKRIRNVFDSGELSKSALTDFLDNCDNSIRILSSNLDKASKLVISFKQLSADQDRDVAREFNLADQLRQVITILGPTIKEKRHKIELHCSEDISLYSNPGALFQVLSNIIQNSLVHAFREMDRGVIDIEVEDTPEAIRISISDNGVGIPYESQSKVFDPFYTTNRSAGCTGLGLHLVHNLVTTKLKGKIILNSSEDNGTCITVVIPRDIMRG